MNDPRVEAGYDHRFDAIQDELLELRDARISILPAPNGLVACEKDGTPSSIIRLRIPDVLRIADQADREQGIHRVKVDDATVEKVARAIYEDEYGHKWELEVTDGQDEYRDMARAILAALTGSES